MIASFEPRRCEYCNEMIEKPQRAAQRFCRQKCSTRWRNRYYLYGIDHHEVAALLAEQGGGCGICGSIDPRTQRGAWHVDHDHVTGVIRGILCHYCNVGIGQFADDPYRLRQAVAYLERARS